MTTATGPWRADTHTRSVRLLLRTLIILASLLNPLATARGQEEPALGATTGMATVLRYKTIANGTVLDDPGLRKTVWIGERCSRNDLGIMSVIVDYVEDRVIVLLPAKMAYVETPRPLEPTTVLPQEYISMLRNSGMTVEVEDLDLYDEDTYPWPCDELSMEIFSLSLEAYGELCLNRELPGATDPKYAEIQLLGHLTLFFEPAAVDEFREATSGIVVASDVYFVTTQGMISTIHVLEAIDQEPMPAGTCSIPPGYRRVSGLSM